MIDKDDPRLTAFVLGELDDAERQEIEDLIADSSEIAQVISQLRFTCGQMQQFFDDELKTSESVVMAPRKSDRTFVVNNNHRWHFWAAACSITALAASIAFVLFSTNRVPGTARTGWTTFTEYGREPDESANGEQTRKGKNHNGSSSVPNEGIQNGDLLSSPQEDLTDNASRQSDADRADESFPILSLIVSQDQQLNPQDQQLPSDFGGEQHSFSYTGRESSKELAGEPEDSANQPAFFDSLFAADKSEESFTGVPDFSVFPDAAEWERKVQRRSKFVSINESEPEPQRVPGDSYLAASTTKSLARDESKNVDDQLRQTQQQLEIALQRFGPTHPAVNELKSKINEIINGKRDKNAKLHKQLARSWKKVKATGNSSRLIIGERDELALTGMQMHVQVDAFRARVLIDYFYYNDRQQQLEGNFKMRLPDDASLYYFAFGQSAYDFSPEGSLAGGEFIGGNQQYVSLSPAEIGLARQDAWNNVKEARMVPREKAAFAYSQTVRRRVDPALVEWSGAGIFNARVFPLMPKKLHRIVIGYDVNLATIDGQQVYDLELPEQPGQSCIELNVTDFEGGHWKLELDPNGNNENAQPTVWDATQTNTNAVSQKRFRFEAPTFSRLKLTSKPKRPLALATPDNAKGKFFATQINVELPVEQITGSQRAIFVVDTSLSSRPEKFNVWLELMRATLDNNRDQLDRFAVLFFDVDCRFWRTRWSENTPGNVDALLADCQQIGLEGATNLHGALLELGEANWLTSAGDTPDVFLLSDGAANWGETNLRLLEQKYASLNLGSLFAYQTGLSGTAISNLRFLAGSSGGAVFSVATEAEIKTASMAHRNKPWQLNSISAEGLSDLMTAGGVKWVYPGQQLTVVGRGICNGDLTLELSAAGVSKTVSVAQPTIVRSDLANRLYGQVAVGQLESLGDTVFDVSSAYARHFRITGKTCSLLMLESEADYQRFDIKPQEDWFVVQSKGAAALVGEKLAKLAQSLADPKAQLLNWISRLENLPGLEFKMPTALKVAMDDMTIESIDSRLEIETKDNEAGAQEYLQNLKNDSLDVTVMRQEMQRRKTKSPDLALRAYSNLVESNPGDWVIARDVAFTAMDLQRPAVAYHLLKKVIRSRPYEGTTYAALGQCLDQLNRADMAMIFYELALGATFQNQNSDFHHVVRTQYRSLLNRVIRGELQSGVNQFAAARRDSLGKQKPSGQPLKKSDLVVVMTWNTDQTDVDLHVVEPSGEECYYDNRLTRGGGTMTADDTDGFGPEMYAIPEMEPGDYQIKIKFYSSNPNRTQVTNQAYLTIYENYGTKYETRSREVIDVSAVGEKVLVKTIRGKRN